jgi:hypothetical protein
LFGRDQIVDSVVKHFEAMQKRAEKVVGQPIRDLVTVNGVRVTVADGSWDLVRASSNKPELVGVVESPVSEQRMRECCERSRRWVSIIRRLRFYALREYGWSYQPTTYYCQRHAPSQDNEGHSRVRSSLLWTS